MRRIAVPLIALAVMASLPSIGGTAQAAPGPDLIVGSGTVHAGMYPNKFWFSDDFDTLATRTGQGMTFAGRFHGIRESDTWLEATKWTLEDAWTAGSTPFSNLQFVRPEETAAYIASGALDAEITGWATDVKDWLDLGGGRSLVIAPMQEMNGDWVYYGMDPANFKIAYARIRTIVEATVTDPTMVRWAFAPNGWSKAPYTLADYYPGDDIVDIISFSIYNFGDHPEAIWKDPAEAFPPYVDLARDTIPGAADKPFLLAQTGSVSSGGDKDQWIRDLFSHVEEDPNLVGFVYFNITETGPDPDRDWQIWKDDVEYQGFAGWADGMARPTTDYQFPLTNWFQPGPLPFVQHSPPCSDGLDCDSIAFVDPGSEISLLSEIHPAATISDFYYGTPADMPLMGDWDGDGTATPGMYRPSNGFVYLRNSNDLGGADLSFYFGIPGDIPIVGDWDNDGFDTLGIYRGGHVFIANTLGTVVAEYDFWFGIAGDRPFTGDFNGDGVDTLGLYRESSGFVYFRDTLDTGVADFSFWYGAPSDRILAGDWNGDGNDTVAVYRRSDDKVYFRMSNTFGVADYTLSVPSGFVEAMTAR